MATKAKNLKKYRNEEHCFWCGRLTSSADYVINPGANTVIKCCSDACYDLSRDFVARDAKARTPFWIVLALLCLANLVVFGSEYTGPWGYLPLLGIAVTVFIWPSLFTHYSLYSRLGLVKTRRVFRVLAVLLGALAVAAALATLQ